MNIELKQGRANQVPDGAKRKRPKRKTHSAYKYRPEHKKTVEQQDAFGSKKEWPEQKNQGEGGVCGGNAPRSRPKASTRIKVGG